MLSLQNVKRTISLRKLRGFVAGNETTPSFGALPEIEDEMEDVKEPEKVVKMKSKEKATTPATEEDLSGLVNKWGTKKK